nr:hypothetical protein [Tanacetum cinerariifolium]
MFEVANLQGDIDLYVCPIPQVCLAEYYFKNLDVVFESDEDVTSIYRGHEKAKKDANTMSFEEIVGWEKEELQSPSYLRSPHVWKSNSMGIGKGTVLLDDFKIVGNGKDKVVLDNAKDGLISTKSDEMDNVEEKTTRIRIPGPAGIFQTDRIRKLRNFKDDPTQQYIRKCNFDDVSEDDSFQSSPWVKALEFMNDRKEIEGGCFGDIKSYLKKGKLETVVAIITSCKSNVLGDMNVTLKDPSGTSSGTIHYKVLSSEDGYAKDIKPFIFDIDGRTLEYGREDFCLITGFQFGEVNLDPDKEDHSEFRMRVFLKTENLKGEHLLELVNKDVKYAKLDDEDVVQNSTVNKVIPSAIEMNELWWRSSLDYFKKVTRSIPVLRSATKGSSIGKSVHTRVRIEVRHEVHVRTEVFRVHSKEEVHVLAVEKKDIQERDELLKTVKEQK